MKKPKSFVIYRHTNTGRRHPQAVIDATNAKITGENSKIAKSIIVIEPDGNERVVKSIANFCKEHGHHASAIRRCLAGKLKSHHGLRFREIAPESLAA